MRILKDFIKLFYLDYCINCNDNLHYSESILCANCKHELPIINLKNYYNNEITTIFYGRIPIKKAVSFLYYNKDGVTKKLIHSLKYNQEQQVGFFIGNWLGSLLSESKQFKDFDFIIPVPLHPTKLKERGYNQLTIFGETLSSILNIDYNPDILIKVSATKTQTFKKRFDRFSNINTKFNLLNTTIFKNKHILLIDDVITTGATLEACCNELQKTENITISIATMAFTQKK